jgi:hypothetical protein
MIITNAHSSDEYGDCADTMIAISEDDVAFVLDKIRDIRAARIAFEVIKSAPFIPIATYPFCVYDEIVADTQQLEFKEFWNDLASVFNASLIQLYDECYWYYVEDEYFKNLTNKLDTVKVFYGYVEVSHTHEGTEAYWRLFLKHCSTALTTSIITEEQLAEALDKAIKQKSLDIEV